MVGHLWAELPSALSPFLVEGQWHYFLHMAQSHRIAGRGHVLQRAESPESFDHSSRPGFLLGGVVRGNVLDLESEVVSPGRAYQIVVDTQGS